MTGHGCSNGYCLAQVSEVNVSDSMGCGQVLDVESGENQTLGPEFTEEVLLQRFPKLKATVLKDALVFFQKFYCYAREPCGM